MQDIIAAYEIPQSGVEPEQVLALCQPHMDSLCKETPACSLYITQGKKFIVKR